MKNYKEIFSAAVTEEKYGQIVNVVVPGTMVKNGDIVGVVRRRRGDKIDVQVGERMMTWNVADITSMAGSVKGSEGDTANPDNS